MQKEVSGLAALSPFSYRSHLGRTRVHRLLCCSAAETEGHGIVISVAVGNHHPVQCSCNYNPLTPFPLAGAGADVGLAQPRLPGSLVHWQPGWGLAGAAVGVLGAQGLFWGV